MFSFIMGCLGFCVMTISVHIVPLAIDRGISATGAAMILSVMNVAMTVGSIIIGIIADKIGSRRMLVICLCLLLGITLFLLPVNSAWILGILVVVMTLGCGGIAVLQGTIVAELFGLRSNGVILGAITFGYTIGSSSGVFIAGLVFDATGNYQWVLLICTFLSIIALIMAISLNRTRKREALA
jgi:MFS family permease